jgi:tetratricopeptide (TPR) repeat protein
MRGGQLIRGAGLVLGLALAGAGQVRAQAVPPRGASPGWQQSRSLASQAASAEIKGNTADALALADQAIAADPSNAWAHYDRGAALARMGQTDQAVQAFSAAEQRFPVSNRWARSIAIWDRALALQQAGRCVQARAAFAEYATYVSSYDQKSAEMARKYAEDCVPKS